MESLRRSFGTALLVFGAFACGGSVTPGGPGESPDSSAGGSISPGGGGATSNGAGGSTSSGAGGLPSGGGSQRDASPGAGGIVGMGGAGNGGAAGRPSGGGGRGGIGGAPTGIGGFAGMAGRAGASGTGGSRGDGGPDASSGICGGLLGATCSANSFCDFEPTAQCGAGDRTGLCQARPQVCVLDCPGVCGCNGQFYCNACIAHRAGIDDVTDRSCIPASDAF